MTHQLRCSLLLCLALGVGACSTSRYERDSETSATLPNGQGLGAFAGACVFLCFVQATFTQRDGAAPTDPAIEILDSAGIRMTTCNDPFADNPPLGAPFAKGAGTFTDACVNHADASSAGSSLLTLKLPPGSNQTLYIHVFDFKGFARPDFIYTLNVNKR